MSNARNLANLLGTSTTIQTAKLADSSISTAKLATDAVTSPKILESSVLFGQSIASGSITSDTGVLDIAFDPINFKKYRMYLRNFWVTDGKQIRIYKLSAANTAVANMSAYGGGTYQGEGITDNVQYSGSAYYPLLGGTTTQLYTGGGTYRCNGVLDMFITSTNQLAFTFHGIARIITGQTVNLSTGCLGINTESPYGIRIQCEANGSGEKIKAMEYSVWAEDV
jgi:hypothetical protein